MEYNMYITSMFNKEEQMAVAIANIRDEAGNTEEFYAQGPNSSIALLKACNSAMKTMPNDENKENVLIIHTDSSYIISVCYNCMNWFFKNMRKKDGSPIANPELVMEFIEIISDKVQGGKEVLEYASTDPGVLKLKVRVVRAIQAGVIMYV